MEHKIAIKNVAQGTFQEIQVDQGFFVLTHANEGHEVKFIERETDSQFIQFHFCVRGSCSFQFNNGNYTLNIKEETSLLLYNPMRDLPISLQVDPNSWLVTILISIKKFHGLFSEEADYISFLNEDNVNKKYYKAGKISPSMSIVLNQMTPKHVGQPARVI